jgi:Flp pilus assembly protein TadG
MRYQPCSRAGKQRRGTATVELAVMVPLLTFLLLVTVDYCRVYYFAVVVTNCARNGAIYGSDPFAANRSSGPYTSIEQAALADARDLTPQPTVTSTSSSDYVEVTVSYSFTTISSYPGIPRTTNLRRTIRMQLAPVTPTF